MLLFLVNELSEDCTTAFALTSSTTDPELLAAYPQANGVIECQHRTFKTSIMSRKQNWLDALPIVLLRMRNIPNEDGVSPAIAVTDTHFLLPQPIISSTSEQSFSSSDIQKLAKEMNLPSSTLLSEGRLHTTTKLFIPKLHSYLDKSRSS